MAFLPLPSPPTTRPARTRTPKQLQRKRTLDKALQKRKRDEQKAYVASIERDLQDARAENEHLRSVIREMQGRSEQAAWQGDPYPPHVSAPMREGPDSGVGTPYARRLSPRPPLPAARQPAAIECYCRPRMHRTYSECFERTVFDGVMKMHRLPMPVPPVPATPELADLLFMREPRDPISNILYKLVRRPNMDSLVIICAVYILAHRILRVRNLRHELPAIIMDIGLTEGGRGCSIGSSLPSRRTMTCPNGSVRRISRTGCHIPSTSTLCSSPGSGMPWSSDQLVSRRSERCLIPTLATTSL